MITFTEETDPRVLTAEAAAGLLRGAPWRRMVTIGDSIAQGVREPVPGYRDLSWADRIEEALARVRPGFTARNLGRRDLLAAQVRAEQLAPALEFGPDLAFVVAGGNDMLARHFDPAAVRGELAAMMSALRAAGADVATIGLFDITLAGLGPAKYRDVISARTRELAAVTAEVAAGHGGCHTSATGDPIGADRGIYSSDGLHLNARGHAIAAANTIRALTAFLSRHPSGGHLASP